MKISEVSDKYNITPDTLRYYERVGLLPYVHRNKSGVRDYTEDDQNWIEFITLMRSAGLPVEVLQHYVELCKQGDGTIEIRKNILANQRTILAAKIEALEKSLARLDYKIHWYDQIMIDQERIVSEEEPEVIAR